MKKLALLLLCGLLLFASCNNPAANPTTYSVDGSVQKGPFQLGSAIIIQTLNKDLDPTGSVFNTQTSDDFGGFSLHSKIPERYVEIQAKGFYFNECAGGTASSEITLRTYADLSSTNAVHINVLTTIAHQRIKALVGSGMTFEAAQGKAEKEILDILGLSTVAGMHFSGYNLESNSSDAALLLAISSAFQQGRSVALLQLFLADLATDLADGSMDNTDLVSQIRAGAEAVTPASVVANLQSYYSGRGKTIAVPDFTSARTALRTAGSMLAKPIPSKSAGTYMSPLEVNLTAPAGSVIKYTTDVAIDPAIGGTEFIEGNPIKLTASGSTPNNVTVRAVAILNGVCSAVTTLNYVVREGRLGSEYVDMTPGHYIEYDLSEYPSTGGEPTTTKAHVVIEKARLASSYNVSFCLASPHSDSGYFPAYPDYASGGSGNANVSGGEPNAAWLYYELQLLPLTIYYGNSYTSSRGVIFTPSTLSAWNSFANVIRLDFDSTGYNGPGDANVLCGTGYVVYAKDIGLVYLELIHTTGEDIGAKETLSYISQGNAVETTIKGTLHINGLDPTGYTVSPFTLTSTLPSGSFKDFSAGDGFEITHYVVPGSYLLLNYCLTGTFNTNKKAFKVIIPSSLPENSILDVGEISTIPAWGTKTPTLVQ